MPSFLKQRPRIALALFGVAAALLAALASVTLLGDDAQRSAAPSTTTTTAPASDEPDDGELGGDGDAGDDEEIAPDAGAGLGGGAPQPTTDGGSGSTGDPGSGTDGAGPDRQPLSGSIVVDGPTIQEGPPEEGGPDRTPISEAAALACAHVEFAVDAWDDDDPGAYQSHLGEAVVLAAEAPEQVLRDAIPAMQEASAAEDPAPSITRVLEACAASGYAL